MSSPQAVRDIIGFSSILADQVPQLGPCERAPGRAFRGPGSSATPPRLLLRLLSYRSGWEVGDQQAAEEVTDSCRETWHIHTLQRNDQRVQFIPSAVGALTPGSFFKNKKGVQTGKSELWSKKVPGGNCWTLFLLSEWKFQRWPSSGENRKMNVKHRKESSIFFFLLKLS